MTRERLLEFMEFYIGAGLQFCTICLTITVCLIFTIVSVDAVIDSFNYFFPLAFE